MSVTSPVRRRRSRSADRRRPAGPGPWRRGVPQYSTDQVGPPTEARGSRAARGDRRDRARSRVEEAPDPTPPGPGGAVVSVDATAICGSDMHFYDGDLDLGMAIPVGHEFLGTVLEVGPDVQRFRVGDRVLTASVAGCGACDGCATGDPVRCVEGPKVFGSGMLPGGQATAVAVPAADFQMLRDPRGHGRRGGPAVDRQPVHRVGRRPAGGVRPRAGRSWCSDWVPSGCAPCARPWPWGRAGSWPSTRSRAGGPGPSTRGPRPSTARRWRRCWRRPADGAPTRSSTRWRRT